MSELTNIKVDMRCEGCGHIMKIRLNNIIPGRIVTCTKCQAAIHIHGNDGRKLQQALNKLDRTLKKFR